MKTDSNTTSNTSTPSTTEYSIRIPDYTTNTPEFLWYNSATTSTSSIQKVYYSYLPAATDASHIPDYKPPQYPPLRIIASKYKVKKIIKYFQEKAS